MNLLTNEIVEIGAEGVKKLRKEMKFGDIVENGWASHRNPIRFGIIFKVNAKDIELTDGEGKFWELVFDKQSKISIRGSILLIDWETDYELLKKHYASV
jgi:hypothetical protein